jgi:hypothetical protein
MKSLAILPIFLLLLAACAIQQRVEPAAAFKTAELCIIENPDVRPTFLEVYRRQLALRAGGVPRLRGHRFTKTEKRVGHVVYVSAERDAQSWFSEKIGLLLA